MHPTLFDLQLGNRLLALDADGLCITLGALAGLLVSLRLARALALPAVALRDLGLELLLVGVLGARLLFVAVHLEGYVASCDTALASGGAALIACTRALWLWEGGMYFQGGLIAALAWLAVRARRGNIGALRLADVFAPGLALGHVFARVGCFLAGCCYGRPTDGPLGLRFPDESAAFQALYQRGLLSPSAESTPPLHAVQLYDAGGHLILFLALFAVARRRGTTGLGLALYLGGHALLQLTLLPFRADGRAGGFALGLSAQQASALLCFAAAAALMWQVRAHRDPVAP